MTEQTTATTAAAPEASRGLKATKAAKESGNGKAPAKKKSVLRKPQVRILGALVKHSAPMTRGRISEAAKVDQAWTGDYLGRTDPAKREANDKKYNVHSLLSLGYVRFKVVDVDGKKEVLFEVTAAGKKAYEKAPKG